MIASRILYDAKKVKPLLSPTVVSSTRQSIYRMPPTLPIAATARLSF